MSDTPVPSEIVPPEKWLELYGDYLFRFALLRLRDHAAAEDAVSETFLAAIRSLDRFDGRVDVKFWLRGILRNKIVDQIRASVKRHAISDREREEMETPEGWLFRYAGIPGRKPSEWGFDPARAFEKDEFWGVFRSCVGKLNGRLQQAFVLKELEELSSEEICKLMDITPNNLWVMVHRARKNIKTCLQRNWSE